MKLIRLFPLLILWALVVLTGCEKDVEDMDLNSSSKLVVFSFISPQDTILTVKLQKSQPAIGKKLTAEQVKVKNATVTITDGNSVVLLTYNQEYDHYEANAKVWPVVAGSTYQLKVSTPGGAIATANCTVPYATGIEITEINTSYTIVQDYFGQNVRRYSVSYNWRDAAGVKNYYRALAYKQYTISSPHSDDVVHREGLQGNNYNMDLQTDAKVKNGLMLSNTLTYHEYNYDVINKPFHIYAVLVVGDSNYYLYHESLTKQYENDGNPFAEPSFIYSNVEGGLGVFSGYNQVVAVKELE